MPTGKEHNKVKKHVYNNHSHWNKDIELKFVQPVKTWKFKGELNLVHGILGYNLISEQQIVFLRHVDIKQSARLVKKNY